jgi:hypothetical protein
MPENSVRKLIAILALTISGQIFADNSENGIEAGYWAFWDKRSNGSFTRVDHSDWDQLLTKYVVINHPSGINRFRYGDVSRADEKRLDSYIETLVEIDPRRFNKTVQHAYWINLYNALVVQQVLEYYPVVKITQVDRRGNPGPWDEDIVEMQDQDISLNDIEHRILRPIWKDHKTHFALACGGLGCPSLQPKAFHSNNLKQQLRQAGRDFIGHPRGLQVSHGKMSASSMFGKYQKDFAKNQKELLKLLAYYSDDSKALYLLGFKGQIKFNDDWRINAP